MDKGKIISIALVSVIMTIYLKSGVFLLFLILPAAKLIFAKYKFDKSRYYLETGKDFLNTVFDKGAYGEFIIFTKLEKLPGEFKIITNAYITKDNGETTELDLVLIHERGIFAIESKNYSGWIYGSENNYKWTVTYNKNCKKKFYNPIKQNSNHIKWLSREINLDREYIKSLVVFGNKATLKKVPKHHDNVYVLNLIKLNHIIKRELKYKPIIYSIDDIFEIYNILRRDVIVSDKVKEDHIKNIKKHLDKNGNYIKKI